MKRIVVLFFVLCVVASLTAQPTKTKYVIKYAYDVPPDSVHTKGAEFFKKRVSELSNGQIEVQLYPSGQLGTRMQVLESLRSGTVEMYDVAATDLSAYSKIWSVFSMPYLFKDEDQLFRALGNDEIRRILDTDAESNGFKIISWWTFGARSMINSKRPVKTPEDLKGLKIRILQNPVIAQVISLMGANPVAMPWSEVYTALQQKTIDGLENSAPLYADNKLYEVAKYFSLTEHFRIPDPELISLKFFNRLPKDLQDAVIQAGQETSVEYRKIWANYEGVAMTTLKNNGVLINTVDKSVFEQKVSPIYADFVKTADGSTKILFEKIKAIK
jgi:tripartite ATP-independent transporter DctP family solute receptor